MPPPTPIKDVPQLSKTFCFIACPNISWYCLRTVSLYEGLPSASSTISFVILSAETSSAIFLGSTVGCLVCSSWIFALTSSLLFGATLPLTICFACFKVLTTAISWILDSNFDSSVGTRYSVGGLFSSTLFTVHVPFLFLLIW